MNPGAILRPGMATACGSLPHTDPEEAARLVARTLPDLPAAPSLPNRSPAEGMIAQVVAAFPGVTITPGWTVEVDVDAFDPDADLGGLPPDSVASTLALVDLLASQGHDGPLKLAVTGPVTAGTALVAAGVAPRYAYKAAARAARLRARQLLDAVAELLPSNPILLVVDEPSLGAASLGKTSLGLEEAVDLVSGTLAVAEARALAGIHCCAAADWSIVLAAGPQVLSLPVELAPTLRAPDLGPFLDRGGWVAWGAVPTGGPLGGVDGRGTSRLWRSLARRWHALADGGVDPVLLRQRAIVTPACGLARHDVRQAELALRLTAALGDRVAAGTVEGAGTGLR